MHLSERGLRNLESILIQDYPFQDIADDCFAHFMDLYELLFKRHHVYPEPDLTSWNTNDNQLYVTYTSNAYSKLLCPFCHNYLFHKITSVNRLKTCRSCGLHMTFVDYD